MWDWERKCGRFLSPIALDSSNLNFGINYRGGGVPPPTTLCLLWWRHAYSTLHCLNLVLNSTNGNGSFGIGLGNWSHFVNIIISCERYDLYVAKIVRCKVKGEEEIWWWSDWWSWLDGFRWNVWEFELKIFGFRHCTRKNRNDVLSVDIFNWFGNWECCLITWVISVLLFFLLC